MKKKYPMIVRDTIDFISDAEVCNIGYNEGVLSDERPYRAECWDFNGVTNLTIFISLLDFEEKSEEEVKEYIVKENLIDIIDDDIYITEVEDSEDNSFLSINVPIETKNKVLNKCNLEMKSFEI